MKGIHLRINRSNAGYAVYPNRSLIPVYMVWGGDRWVFGNCKIHEELMQLENEIADLIASRFETADSMPA